jgi:two-component system chemotaxis response regulator CheB
VIVNENQECGKKLSHRLRGRFGWRSCAYTRLLQHLPADMGVAIVIVNHVRNIATMLHEILPRFTKMSVELITEKLDIQPDHVFIIPEGRDLHILDDEFRLKPISKPRGGPM